MIIDPAGNDYHLPRYIDGMNSKQVNEFMRDVDRASLPSIQQAKEQQQERRIAGLEAERDRYHQTWEKAVMDAAIEKEEKERRFVEPEQAHAPAGPARPPQTREQSKEETRAGREQTAPTRREEKQFSLETWLIAAQTLPAFCVWSWTW